MAAESFQTKDKSYQDDFPTKQPERHLVNFFSGNLFFGLLKLSIVTFPLLAAAIIILYSVQYTLPIIDSVGAVSGVILYLSFITIFLILLFLTIVIFPAFISQQFSQSVRNSYIIYKPCKKNMPYLNLSLGGILLYGFHIWLLWYIQDDLKLSTELYLFSISVYLMLLGLSTWALVKICKQSRQRRDKARQLAEEKKARFRSKECTGFMVKNNLVSVLWVALIYLFLLLFGTKNWLGIAFFAVFSPFVISVYYNIISGLLNNIWKILTFSLTVIVAIIFWWPNGAALSRMVFHLLGIGGGIPVQIALLPGNKLGLREGVIKQSEPSGSIYGEMIGPFRLILYGKEKIYLLAMNDQKCLPTRAGTTLTDASCQRIFSIPTKYIVSIDTTKSAPASLNSSR